jgi:hypothetical protein
MSLPRAARQFVKLLPIAFVPGRHFVHAPGAHCLIRSLMLLWMQKLRLRWHPRALLRSAKSCRLRNAISPGLLAGASLLTIYACTGLTRHFGVYCFKPVTGLNVSRTFTSATAAAASPGTGRVTCRSVCSREAAECACILRVYLHTCQQKQFSPVDFGGHPEAEENFQPPSFSSFE